MDHLDRNITAGRGPRFFRGDHGEVLFEFVLDPTNKIGPRPATARDRSDHADAYRSFSSTDMGEAQAEAPESPATLPQVEEIAGRFNGADPAAFDHDGDGKPGGSKPQATADRVAPRTRAKRGRKG